MSDLEAHVKQQDEIWRSKVRDYELQVAAEYEHQKAETHKLEIEVHQHGQGIQITYKMDKKPQEYQFQVKNQPQQRKKLKDEPKMGGYGNMKEMVKKQEAEYRKKGMEQKKTFQDQLSVKWCISNQLSGNQRFIGKICINDRNLRINSHQRKTVMEGLKLPLRIVRRRVRILITN